jgi:surface protein
LYAVFQGASSFNQDLSSWDTSNVDNTAYTFNGASAFNQDVGSWDTSNVTDMGSMFASATSFNQPLTSTPGGWDTSKVTSAAGMFSSASAFNQDISSWDTGLIADMSYMFESAASFDQNIGGWNVASLTDGSEMFTNVTLSLANYNALLVGWSAQEVNDGVGFNGGNSQYSLGGPEEARSNLVDTKAWSITDGGLSERPELPSAVGRRTQRISCRFMGRAQKFLAPAVPSCRTRRQPLSAVFPLTQPRRARHRMGRL